jgi:ribosome recycling factor
MEDWRKEMHWWLEFAILELLGLRAGLFGSEAVERVEVDVRAGRYPLKRLAVLAERPDRVLVRPFDPDNLPAILRAIAARDGWMKAAKLDDRTIAVAVPPVPEAEQRSQVRRVKRVARETKATVKEIARRAQLRRGREGPIFAREVERSAAEVLAQLDRMIAAKLHELGAGKSKA